MDSPCNYSDIKSREDFIIVAIIMEAMFLFTINYTTREMRKEFKEIAPELDDKIKDTINSIVTILEQIKKKLLSKQIQSTTKEMLQSLFLIQL